MPCILINKVQREKNCLALLEVYFIHKQKLALSYFFGCNYLIKTRNFNLTCIKCLILTDCNFLHSLLILSL